MRFKQALSFGLFASLCLVRAVASIVPAGASGPANAESGYATLRAMAWEGEGVSVTDLTLEREGGKFHFESGIVYFFADVKGKPTGAVFSGKGSFELKPEAASERHSLSLLTKSESMQREFSTLVLRFTDGTAEEIRKAASGRVGAPPSQMQQAATQLANVMRHKLHENLELRILEDAESERRGGFFLATFTMRVRLSDQNVFFIVDPSGSPHAAPDEVELSTFGGDDFQTWVAYRMHSPANALGLAVHVSDQRLEVGIERSGAMHCVAETTIAAKRDGVRVIPLNLYRTLRVTGVYGEDGKPLDYVQEGKDDDPDFAVILPKPVKAGQSVHVLIEYGGTGALQRDGDDTYYLIPAARESWYPSGHESLGGFANYHMIFHLPPGLQIVATGRQVSSDSDGKKAHVSTWESGTPIAVAGFNLGNFKSRGMKTPDGFAVDAFANVNLPDWASRIHGDALGTLATTPALNDEISQGNAAIQIYTSYFGRLPYDHVALTQQSACDYGQSWPMLVYLPLCAFWDNTVKHQLGLLDQDPSYWKEVTPHEVSHQWWGQMVGFSSYRDQWMSEGFAHFSVGVYLMQTRPKMDEYRAFWEEQRKRLIEKNRQGIRPIDVGPVTMGMRVSSEKAGEDVYQKLIYSKGAYIVHMLELMYWTPKLQDAPFRAALQRFVRDYSGKAATTEDFKASLEKDLPKWIDADGNGKLDWFFNEYVYGTEIPHYTIASEFTTADGETSVHVKVTQSGISDKFVMPVPVYLQMQDGNTVKIANFGMVGSKTVERTLKLGKLPSPGKKLLLNYNLDVLSD